MFNHRLLSLVLLIATSALLSGGDLLPIPDRPAVEKAHPVSIPLWPHGPPGFESRSSEPEKVAWRQEPGLVFPVTSNIHNPSLTPYLPAKGKGTGAAVIIAPGGGHTILAIEREGYDLGEWLAKQGIAAFVLKYRLARDHSNPPGVPQPYKVDTDALGDAQRALRLVRSRSSEWTIDPARIGILGFSAGGEVALLAATRHDAGQPGATDPIEQVSSRPDYFALLYPGGLNRTDVLVTKESTPPAFLACAFDDQVAETLPAFFTALNKAGVNAELHIYNSGGHGFGVRLRPLAVTGWSTRFVEWLNDRGFLKRTD